MKFRSITQRLMFLFVLVAALPLAIFGYLSIKQSEQTMLTETEARMTRLADKKTLEIKRYLATRVDNARLMARSDLVEQAMLRLGEAYAYRQRDAAHYNKLNDYFLRPLSSYIDEIDWFYDVFLISPEGEIVFTNKHEDDFATNLISGPLKDSALAQAFRETRMTLESSVSDFEYYTPSQVPAAFITAPIIRHNKLEGVIAFQISTAQIYQASTDAIGLGKTGETVLAKLEKDGSALITAPLKSDEQAAMQRKIDLHGGYGEPMRRALRGERGAGFLTDYRGHPVIAAWRYIPELHWGMVVKIDAAEAFAPIRREQQILLGMLFSLLLFAATLAYVFGRRLVNPIKQLALSAEKLAEEAQTGQLALVNLERPVFALGEDEVGHLGRAFNRMTESLQTLYRTLEERVAERTNELYVSNEQLNEEVNERMHAEIQLHQTNEDLLRAKQQYERLTTNIEVGVYLLNSSADGKFIFKFVSARFCQMLDVTASEVYQNSRILFDVIHPDDLDEFMQANKVAITTRQKFEWEGRAQVRDAIKWLHIESLPEPKENGDCIWDGVVIDITEERLVEAKLKAERDLNQIYLNTAQSIMVALDTDGNISMINAYGAQKLGYTPEQLIGRNWFHTVLPQPDGEQVVFPVFLKLMRGEMENVEFFENDVIRQNGRRITIAWHNGLMHNADGRIIGTMSSGEDITEKKIAEDSLRIAATAFETHEAIMITDREEHIIRVNRAFEEITGYSFEEVKGKTPRILSSGRQNKSFYRAMWEQLLSTGNWTGEIWDRRKNGEIYPKSMTITAVKNSRSEVSEFVAIFSDITERKHAEEEIRNLAFYDALTRLPNRRLLTDRFHLALSLSARSNEYGAVLFLDMDRFKTLNDTLGNDHGDDMLLEVANRLESCVREADTVARLGGDEFVILLEALGTTAEETSQRAAQVAEKIRISLTLPYQIKGHIHHSSPSIGVTLYHGTDESVEELLKHADMAMYQAKESGRNAVRFYDPLMQQSVETRSALEADLRGAITDQQFQLYYQIQVDEDRRALGAEALIRWIHPTRGMVSPAQFIPIAEETSLILDIGQWVMDTACRQLSLWQQDEQHSNLLLAINVSSQQFRLPDFVARVEAAIRMHNIRPEKLKLELTESVVLNDVADIVAKMYALKALGVRLSLDDFGTGYSSLSYLKSLPLDQLKIDQSFVRDIVTDPNDAVMVQTIIDMATNFRLNVIAEGVETEAQLAFLKLHGCTAYQGYLFSKSVPIGEFEALFERMHTK